MLSYQHAYHAGNAADVHKHALLALALEYLARKPKPLTYFETHAGRALYDLSGPEARKTGEAAAGVARMERWFAPDHPYAKALAEARRLGGPDAYPGSPLIARTLLRGDDRIVLAERHPQEVEALRDALPTAEIHDADGPSLAMSLTPPEPRRGVLLIDPSYEVKSEWSATPEFLARIRRKWPVGVLMLWYPILASGAHRELTAKLDAMGTEGVARSEVRFPPAREGHRMIGSGLWLANPPWGWEEAARDLAKRFAALKG
ncbi:23S rRNA (adenine(2030)-N(6))-methyltransferase RlmJ [Albimonas sp. CAU 1670]|uniref:23S rRNA (adenine(2030)-N(6))-methyltransferase RlmJ n=1 Tax=Albimonas sp. CAU 1670 TaxID=3032599 RepID=UPI0023DAD2B4|nr:23S rRNA (adenine(2030)-N(6))-methyltransferase RlmJ [Albimonas sp. CAU 1670]MDF2234736.1 23S rRNA (adenine(2030)-N(6))-methyltransferase RlmJ [Albimonas sp. CAU 1670]